MAKKPRNIAVNDNGPDPARELLRAAEGGELDKVKQWLKLGAPVDARATNNDTPLIIASREGHLEVVHYLLTRKKNPANPAAQNNQGETALIAALRANTRVILDVLVGTAPDARDENGRSAACHAAGRDNAAVIKALATAGADLDQGDENHVTPLMIAAKSGSGKAAGALFDAGVMPNRQDKNGMTALMYAVEAGKTETALLIAEKGADAALKNNAGMTACDIARDKGDTALATRLEFIANERYVGYHKGTARKIEPMKRITLTPKVTP